MLDIKIIVELFLIGGNFIFLPIFILRGINHIFKDLLINEEITAREVRLISNDGEQLGIVDINKARSLANSENLDLVLLTASANPQVCKLMDYGKFKFDQLKKEKELKKTQRIIDTKEIQLSLTIDQHDIDYRAKHANEFLKDGDKVKIVLKLKGRQQAFVSRAIEIVNQFYSLLQENGSVDKQPEVTGKFVILTVSPKK